MEFYNLRGGKERIFMDLSDLRFATVILVDPNPTAALEKPEETAIRRRAPR